LPKVWQNIVMIFLAVHLYHIARFKFRSLCFALPACLKFRFAFLTLRLSPLSALVSRCHERCVGTASDLPLTSWDPLILLLYFSHYRGVLVCVCMCLCACAFFSRHAFSSQALVRSNKHLNGPQHSHTTRQRDSHRTRQWEIRGCPYTRFMACNK